MKKVLGIILVLMFTLMSIAGCGSGGDKAAAPSADTTPKKGSIIIKFGSVINETHPVFPAMKQFEENVEKRTDGIIDVQVYPTSQLGAEREMLEGLSMGTVEAFYGGSMTLSGFTSKAKFQGLPFFFSGGKQAALEFFKLYGEEISKEINKETGINIIWTDNGSFNPANSVRAIKTPKDFAGLKFRCHEIDVFIKGYEALGAVATPMAFTEVYTALQQGTITGTNTNNLLLLNNKFYEVCKYYSPMNIFYDVGCTAFSQKFLDGLSEEYKQIVMEEGANFRDKANELIVAAEVETDKQLEAGLVTYTRYTAAELKPFVDSVQPVYEWFRKNVNEPNLDKYLNAVAEINAKYLK